MSEPATEAHFSYGDDPDLPGWKRWKLRDDTRFNAFLGRVQVRLNGDLASFSGTVLKASPKS